MKHDDAAWGLKIKVIADVTLTMITLVGMLTNPITAVGAGPMMIIKKKLLNAAVDIAVEEAMNQLLPMIRGHLGDLIIHASAAAVDGGAVAFVAQTGRGKSTLAAAFARAGMPFLSDDGLCLAAEGGRYLASPNRSSFRLWLDSEAEVVLGKAAPDEWDQDAKSRVEASDSLPFQAEPLPLRAMYFLGPGEAAKPVIVGLTMREALAQLLNHSFFLDAEDRVRMTRHFEALTRLAEAVPSFALDYPRDYALLPDVIAAVTGHDIEREPAL